MANIHAARMKRICRVRSSPQVSGMSCSRTLSDDRIQASGHRLPMSERIDLSRHASLYRDASSLTVAVVQDCWEVSKGPFGHRSNHSQPPGLWLEHAVTGQPTQTDSTVTLFV
jgi:hypothetical protein